jgi:hypothetical protein
MSAEQGPDREGVLEQWQRRIDLNVRRYDLVTVAGMKALSAVHSDTYPVVSLYLDVRHALPQQADRR